MAEKVEKKPDEKPAPPPAAPAAAAEKKSAAASGGLLKSTPVMLGAVMILEAAVLFAGFKFLGTGAKAAHGGEVVSEEGEKGAGEGEKGKADKSKFVEVKVVEKWRATNRRNGRSFQYDISIFARTRSENQKTLEEKITDNSATIQDRIRTIIAQSDPEKLGGGSEPGLETLRRQVKFQLDEIVGEGLVEEVLIPVCMPFRTDL